MGKIRRENKVSGEKNTYKPLPFRAHVLTAEQGREFERRQSAPPRQPTPAERELVRMYRATVK